MNRILLCNLPFYRLLGSHYNSINLGLAYTAASLNQKGFDCWIYNADFQSGKYGNLKQIFEQFQTYKDILNNENHEIWNETVEKILSFNPDIVGYSCYTANIKSIDIISSKVKKINPNIKQIIGGPHAILDPLVGKSLPNIDSVHHKEGEYLYRLTRDIIQIDDLPFPERDKIWGIGKEDLTELDLSYIMTSRGCSHACKFCSSPKIWKRKIRFRSVASIIEEMKLMIKKYKIKEFYILDDNFIFKNSRTKELLKEIKKLNIKWKCNLRLDCLNDEVCQLMKDGGCIEAKVGVESGSDRILKLINKKETKAKMRVGISLLKKYNIPITSYFIVGFPFETNEDVRETIDFAKEIKADRYSLSVYAPYFGSEIYYDLVKNNLISDEEKTEYFYHQNPYPIVNKNLSKELLNEYFKLAERK